MLKDKRKDVNEDITKKKKKKKHKHHHHHHHKHKKHSATDKQERFVVQFYIRLRVLELDKSR
jgi:dihydroxyacetone kinase-like predicted kinase